MRRPVAGGMKVLRVRRLGRETIHETEPNPDWWSDRYPVRTVCGIRLRRLRGRLFERAGHPGIWTPRPANVFEETDAFATCGNCARVGATRQTADV